MSPERSWETWNAISRYLKMMMSPIPKMIKNDMTLIKMTRSS